MQRLFYFLDFFPHYICRLALTHPEVFWCMDPQAVEKQCWPKLSLITPQVGHKNRSESNIIQEDISQCNKYLCNFILGFILMERQPTPQYV